MNWIYKFAKACAFIPIFVGVIVLIAWLFGLRDGLGELGGVTLFLGLGLMPLGLLAIGVYYWVGSRQTKITRQQIKSNLLNTVGLFLLAGVTIAAVQAAACRYTVEIQNGTQRPLNEVRIVGAGVNIVMVKIQPGATVQRTFCIQHDGVLRVEMANGENNYSQAISGYVNKLHGERYGKVRIDSTGEISVTTEPKRIDG